MNSLRGLRQQPLPTAIRTYRFDVREQVESTQTLLEEAVRRGEADDGLVIAADGQARGRGRHGREWLSPPGVNLYASVMTVLPVSLPQALQYQFVAALAAHGAIAAQAANGGGAREDGGPALWIKWPNDIWWGGRKLAGLLLSTHGETAGVTAAVLGIGINVNAGLDQLPGGATSLRQETGEPASRTGLLLTFLRLLSGWEEEWRTNGWDSIRRAWLAAARFDQCQGYLPGCLPTEGRLRLLGLGEHGELVAEDAAGQRRTLTQADVSLRISPA